MTKGYKNEYDFAKAINNKKYSDLKNPLKNFVKFIFDDVKNEDILKCKRYGTYDKADVYIELNGERKNISIKSGQRVSVHAEIISSFTEYLKKIHINKTIIDYLLLYHYGDYTLDGKGKVRLTAKELKIIYEKEINLFNKYVNHKNIIRKIIIRCLFEGTSKENIADYIYYGTVQDGVYASREEITKYLCNANVKNIPAPHFSLLIYQNWNRNIVDNKKLESHRYYCQFKWPSILEDLQNIRNK